MNTIRENYKKENNPRLVQRAEEYIAHIISLQSARTVDKRFYIMFEYEGDNGKFSRNFKEIWRSMKNTERDIRSKLVSTGNLVVTPKDENFHACEILYRYYNPISCINEPLQERINRLFDDCKKSPKAFIYGHDTNRITDVTVRFFPS